MTVTCQFAVKERIHGIVLPDFAFVRQHHDGGAGEHLHRRGDPKHNFFADRLLRFDIGVAGEISVMPLARLVGEEAIKTSPPVAIQESRNLQPRRRSCIPYRLDDRWLPA